MQKVIVGCGRAETYTHKSRYPNHSIIIELAGQNIYEPLKTNKKKIQTKIRIKASKKKQPTF